MSSLTDEEDALKLKRWMKVNAPIIIIAVLLAIGLSLGLRYWKAHELQQSQQASNFYYQLVAAPTQSDGLAQTLMTQYSKTPYAGLAAMILAKNDVDQNHLAAAAEHLQWAMDHGSDKAIHSIARINRARILIEQGQAQEAITSLKGLSQKNPFIGLALEVEGDAQLALKNPEAAKKDYTAALKALPENTRVQTKLSNLQPGASA